MEARWSLGVSEVMSGAGMGSSVICQNISLLPPKRDGIECPAELRDVLAQSLCPWGVRDRGLGWHRVSLDRKLQLKLEIFPAATDSRYIRAVSVMAASLTWGETCSPKQELCPGEREHVVPMPALISLSVSPSSGRTPCYWLFTHEPHPGAAP